MTARALFGLVAAWTAAWAAGGDVLWGPDGLGLTPPPGWSAQPRPSDRPDVLFLLEGPAARSFALSRFAFDADAGNRAVVQAALSRVVGHVNRRAGTRLKPLRALRRAALENGASVDYLLSSERGRPPLAVGLCRFQGRRLLAMAAGGAPDSDLRRILETLRLAGSTAAAPSGPGPSSTSAPRTSRGKSLLWAVEAAAALALLWLWKRSRTRHG